MSILETVAAADKTYFPAAFFLGMIMQQLGDPDGAAAAYRQALEIEEAAYGPEHPETIATVGNLAGLLQENGDLDTAEELYRKVSSWVLFQAQYSDS